jgi:hypothetical protein
VNKAYSRINFQNAPSTATPLNATNLNKIDKAINDLDDRIIELSGYQEEAEESAEMASASASAAAKAAETATADAEARVNEVIQGLEVYTKADSHKKFASVIKQVATGSPILIKDGTDAGAIDFKGKGRSTQNGTPTPDMPIAIKSVADSGYFDGELLQGYYDTTNGNFTTSSVYVCSKNIIPCKPSDAVVLKYEETAVLLLLSYYDENGNYLSRKSVTNVNSLSDTVPANAYYFHISINSGDITPTNAKHITVTINGKYALIVKSRGKNLLQHTVATQTINGVTFTVNDDKSVTVNGTATDNATLYLTQNMPVENGKTYIVNGTPSSASLTNYYMVIQKRLGTTFITSAQVLKEGLSVKCDDTFDTLYLGIAVLKGKTVNNLTFYPMIRLADTNDTYEPYKELVSYIPLNEPLRSSLDGTVTDEVSLTEVTRRFKEVVFDGSDDENWGMSYGRPTISIEGIKQSNEPISICSHFKNRSYANVVGEFFNYQPTEYDLFFIVKEDLQSLTNWKAWLKANPITVQYELAEPITETIEPVDIVTYDNVTYISNADNAEMEVTYATDTKSYIDSKFAELHAALANML